MTAETKDKKQNGTPVLYDADGNAVPTKYIKKVDRLQHRNCYKYLKRAKELQGKLKKFKDDLLETSDWLYQMMREDAHIYTGKKGNYTLVSFDKQVKIEVSIQERLEFSEKINMAKEKIEAYLDEKLKGQDDEIRQLVNYAFQTSKGKLDTKRVFSLFEINISDKRWEDAMDLIRESISRNFSKRYVRIWEKDSEGEYQAIDLNFSSL